MVPIIARIGLNTARGCVTSNNGKDPFPGDDGIMVEKPLGILTGNDGYRGARSRDTPSRQDGALSDGRYRMYVMATIRSGDNHQ